MSVSSKTVNDVAMEIMGDIDHGEWRCELSIKKSLIKKVELLKSLVENDDRVRRNESEGLINDLIQDISDMDYDKVCYNSLECMSEMLDYVDALKTELENYKENFMEVD